MPAKTPRDTVAADFATIAETPRRDLAKHWQAEFNVSPPKGLSRRLLAYALTYRIQEKAYGGLRAKEVRMLERLASPELDKKERQPAQPQRKIAGPGTRLVREWHGETHFVDVLDDGCIYKGATYRSLSEIARLITGTRWSGPRFFGL
ncbi:MAG: DUF2924 domain-containing protein [Rhodospirillaceae bacterium]|nr:DUF2924 domain-containing protein [Rhodospirillaceae bacterium]